MKLWHAPTGKLIRGHVLDCNQRAFNEALRAYDSQLYTVWNPHKIRGWGCWEIRRKPNKKSLLYQTTWNGMKFYRAEYLEIDHVHHVLDCAFLNYDAIRRLKEMDAWGNKQWVRDMEAREDEYREQVKQKAREELKYALKQNKRMSQDFLEAVRSGIHPAQVLLSTNWRLK